VVVSPTEAGRAAVLADRQRRDAWLAQQLRDLSPAERATLRAAAPILARLAVAD
jgi:DNA-binding MarR family transcriptional regulator